MRLLLVVAIPKILHVQQLTMIYKLPQSLRYQCQAFLEMSLENVQSQFFRFASKTSQTYNYGSWFSHVVIIIWRVSLKYLNQEK